MQNAALPDAIDLQPSKGSDVNLAKVLANTTEAQFKHYLTEKRNSINELRDYHMELLRPENVALLEKEQILTIKDAGDGSSSDGGEDSERPSSPHRSKKKHSRRPSLLDASKQLTDAKSSKKAGKGFGWGKKGKIKELSNLIMRKHCDAIAKQLTLLMSARFRLIRPTELLKKVSPSLFCFFGKQRVANMAELDGEK